MSRRATRVCASVALGLSAFAVPGCLLKSALASRSSARIGCSPEDIAIENEEQGLAPTWEAVCDGRRYYCTGGETTECRSAKSGDFHLRAAQDDVAK